MQHQVSEPAATPEKCDDPLPPVRPGTPRKPSGTRYREQFGVIVVCSDEAQQRAVFDGLQALFGCKLRVVVT